MSAEDNLRVPPKKFMDPNAVKYFKVDWSDYLEPGVTIADSEWDVTVDPDSALILPPDEQSNTTVEAIVQVANPTAGMAYWVTNHCAFSDGTEDDQSIIIIGRDM